MKTILNFKGTINYKGTIVLRKLLISKGHENEKNSSLTQAEGEERKRSQQLN